MLVLGSGRLEAAEHAVRAAAAGTPVTVALTTSDPLETGVLTRLVLDDLVHVLGPVLPGPELRIVLDDDGALAAATGSDTGDGTESAVRVRDGRIVLRADGWGAAHAVAATG